ncbi:MAG: hypothetical protein AAFU79_12640 [Myxococcota bacterium]
MHYRDIALATLASYAAACASAPAPAPEAPVAAPPSPQEELRSAVTVLFEVFPHLDCELDRVVDVGEVDEHNSQVFRRYDSDHSINLSRNEYERIHLQEPATSDIGFTAADRDGDGLITVIEFRNHLSSALQAVDADNDGEVSLNELEGVWRRLQDASLDTRDQS